MGDMKDIFNSMREIKKERRQNNYKNSIKILDDQLIPYTRYSGSHIRVGDYDFWPSTGLFIHIKTKRKKRGVFNLIILWKKEEKKAANRE